MKVEKKRLGKKSSKKLEKEMMSQSTRRENALFGKFLYVPTNENTITNIYTILCKLQNPFTLTIICD